MSKDKQPSRLCPFKRIVEREYSGLKGMVTMRERFDVCAGERCMAYKAQNYGLGESGEATCKRLDGGR